LSTREIHTSFAEKGLVPADQTSDVLIDRRERGRAVDRLLVRVFRSETDVLVDALAEEENLLGDEADLGTQPIDRPLLDRNSVDEDRSGRSRIDTRDQAEKRALPASDPSDKSRA